MFVVHELVLPSFQLPLTTAFASGAWLLVWIVTVADAVHVLCCVALAPSRSPTMFFAPNV